MKVEITTGGINKVPWIKEWRAATGWGLKESKELADKLDFNPLRCYPDEPVVSTEVDVDITGEQVLDLSKAGLVSSSSVVHITSLLRQSIELCLDMDDRERAKCLIDLL